MAEIADTREIKKLIEELKDKTCQANGTCLVSIYRPAGGNLKDLMELLSRELATANMIKDKNVRKNVQRALSSIQARLKHYTKLPENGIIIFAGVTQSGKLEVHIIEPPEPLTVKMYRCDVRFYLDPLKQYLLPKEKYGILLVERGEATFAMLSGSRLEILKEISSHVPGKFRAGGQSAQRFERSREILAHQFMQKVGKLAEKYFLQENKVEGIIVGGPGPTKEEFMEKDYLRPELKKKVIAVVDTAYGGYVGAKEAIMRAQDKLKDVRYVKERNLVQEFLEHISREDGYAVYGIKPVLEALQEGIVEKLLVSEKLDFYRVRFKCPQCSHEERKILKKDDLTKIELGHKDVKCPKCGASMLIEDKQELIDYLEKIADEYGTQVEIISAENEEGFMLLKAFGGIAAILREKRFL